MLQRLKYKFMLFMQGRYGIDDFYYFLLILYTALIVLNIFLRSAGIYLAIWVVLIYSFFRVFSKNISKRQQENAKYLILKRKASIYFRNLKTRFKDKDHVYRKCPSCHATLRFPKRKGRHNARCPRCQKEFKVRVL